MEQTEKTESQGLAARTWKSHVGTTIDAHLVNVEGDAITLKTPGERILSVKRSALCKEDQDYVDSLCDEKQGRWTVLFRSDDPAQWSSKDAATIAPDNFKYLKLRRPDTGQCVIIPITKDQLAGHHDVSPNHAWHGNNEFSFEAHHLGICDFNKEISEGSIVISAEPENDMCGWGFGHKTNSDDKQYFSWDGEEIPKVILEIAVSLEQGLLPEEEKSLLK